MMEGNIEDWRKAGNIAAEALHYGKSLIKNGAKVIDVCDNVEDKIRELGGEIAFPAQISMNNVAAHYCPPPNDDTVFDKDVCSLDVGVHVNGAVGDNALTVDLSKENGDLVKASCDALQAATEVLEVGVEVRKVGEAIHDAITSQGFSPIKNLSGHGLGLFQIHTSPSIPNYDNNDRSVLQKGMTIAIEPFATDGKGMIQETNNAHVFMFKKKKPVRSMITRELLKHIREYQGLPFTTRWLTQKMPEVKVVYGLNDMLRNGIISGYPPLSEVDHGIVTQAENSFLIDDEVETLTKLK